VRVVAGWLPISILWITEHTLAVDVWLKGCTAQAFDSFVKTCDAFSLRDDVHCVNRGVGRCGCAVIAGVHVVVVGGAAAYSLVTTLAKDLQLAWPGEVSRNNRPRPLPHL
jgi:hypothetical protein